MPIQFDPDVIQSFFGARLESQATHDRGFVSMVDYNGKNLKYQVIFSDQDETLSISGDPDAPFGGDSLYEIHIPCDSITESPDAYYPGQMGLSFWYGDSSKKHNLMMMLLKRPDGDLKVWPACPWPKRHPLFKMVWENSDSESYT